MRRAVEKGEKGRKGSPLERAASFSPLLSLSDRPIGCVRRGGRWHAYSAADLLALLGLEGDDETLVDCDDDVPAALLARLEARGVTLAPGGHDVLHVGGAPMSTAEARAVKVLRRALHRVLLDREGPADA